MGAVRSCVLLFILLVQYQNVVGMPFWDTLCDMFCSDSDSSESSSGEDTFDACSLCSDSSESPDKPSGTEVFNLTLPAVKESIKFIVKKNSNGNIYVNVDTLGGGSPSATTSSPTSAASASTTAATTAGSTTPGSTTAKA